MSRWYPARRSSKTSSGVGPASWTDLFLHRATRTTRPLLKDCFAEFCEFRPIEVDLQLGKDCVLFLFHVVFDASGQHVDRRTEAGFVLEPLQLGQPVSNKVMLNVGLLGSLLAQHTGNQRVHEALFDAHMKRQLALDLVNGAPPTGAGL